MSRGDVDADRQAKNKVKPQSAFLSALQLAGAASAGLDTVANAPFAGKKGREKIKNTKFTSDSLLDNAVEGTDVMENWGMEPGALKTYIAGTTWDYVNPVALVAGALKIPAMGASLTRNLGEYLSKSAFKDKLGRKLPKEKLDDILVIAKAAEEAKVKVPRLFGMGGKEVPLRKAMSNPKKAKDALSGKAEMEYTGGQYSVNEMRRSEDGGLVGEAGRRIKSTIEEASPTAPKINRGEIHRKKVAEAKAYNADDTQIGKVGVDGLDRKIRSDIAPYNQIEIEAPPKLKMKDASAEDLGPELSSVEAILNSKKQSRLDKYSTSADEPPTIPRMEVPPIPSQYDDMGIEELIATMSDMKNKKAKVESSNAAIDASNKAAKPTKEFKDVDKLSPVSNMWELRKSVDDKIEKRSWVKAAMDEPQQKEQEYLIRMRQEIDDRIQGSLDKVNVVGGTAKDKYLKDKDTYSNLKTLEYVAEADLLAKTRGEGDRMARTAVAESGRMAASKGASAPFSAGRVLGDFVTGSKSAMGDLMERPIVGQAISELPGEMLEVPFDHKYVQDRGGVESETTSTPEKVKDIPVDMSRAPEEYKKLMGGRGPQSVVEIPGAGDAADIMAPQPEQDPINQKMDEVLAPQKPIWEPYINEEVLNTYLPRDSKRILANPTALMAKVQQVAPNQVPMIQELLDKDPEGMAEAGPKIAMMFPTIFEKDKYDMFDGKILDPMMQQKFLKDLSDDEEMDSIEKANMSMKIQRGESIHG